MSTAAIEISQIEKNLGRFYLGPLSLSVPRGAIYALIGPNGAGKTTTLDLLMGMGQPDLGSIQMLGLDWKKDEVEIKRRTAYVSPDLNYFAWKTVDRAIGFVSGFYPDWDHSRCDRLLGEFGVSPAERISALSFGARIKLALVMALARDAELLLLDEPTVGLDAVSRRQLFTELLAFMQREDRTILISSHQLTDLERFADHVAILNGGRLLTSGRMDQLVERYCQVQVRKRGSVTLPTGARLVKDDGDRLLVLLDLTHSSRESLHQLGFEIIGDMPLTLEELFLALVATEIKSLPKSPYIAA